MKSKFNIDSPYSPIVDSNILIKNKNYDKTKTNYTLKGREETTSPLITSIY